MRKIDIKAIILLMFLVVVCSQQNIHAEKQDWAAHFISAAEQGNPKAQLVLGVMYNQGYGVSEDLEIAFAWIEQAAKQGDSSAQRLLGLLYVAGSGIPKDKDKALALFHESTVTILQRFYETPEHAVFRGGYEGVIQAAENGHSLAQSRVGLMYLTGAGVAQDDATALYWFKQSGTQGVVLAYMYEEGRGGLLKDKGEAMRLYINAAENDVQIILDSIHAGILMWQYAE